MGAAADDIYQTSVRYPSGICQIALYYRSGSGGGGGLVEEEKATVRQLSGNCPVTLGQSLT